MLMDKQSLISKLELIGESTYAAEHRKALDDLCPDGKFTQIEWNEASSVALIKAMAVMIAENEAFLRTKNEIPQSNP